MTKKAYFINNNTMELKEEYKGVLPNNLSAADQAATITYQLKEQAYITELLSSLYKDLVELVYLNQQINLI